MGIKGATSNGHAANGTRVGAADDDDGDEAPRARVLPARAALTSEQSTRLARALDEQAATRARIDVLANASQQLAATRHRHPMLSRAEIARVAVIAERDPASVVRYLRGLPTRSTTTQSIERALTACGYGHLVRAPGGGGASPPPTSRET